MSRFSRILDQFINHIPRRLTGRAMRQCLVPKHHGTIRNVGRDLEELELRIVPSLLGQQLFPANYPMNQNIANAPVAANSAAIINHIGAAINIHPDVGYDSPAYGDATLYGIPFTVVHGNTVPKVNVIIDGYPSQSDQIPVPIPANAVISGDYQNGPNDNGPGYGNGQRGDSDLLIWDEDNNIAYELFGASRPQDSTNSSGQWEATQETVWKMNTDEFRTLGETSADAAGLSMLAGLLRPDEALPVSQGGQGAIDHALRFTLPSSDINPQYIYPASHEATGTQSSTSLPMGGRLRLENTPAIDAQIAQMGPEAQIVATALQQYGLILADEGAAMFITGSSASVNANNQISLTWGDSWGYSPLDDILSLESLTASDFQVVNLTPVVTSLSESTGSAGNTVTITGNNFAGAAGNLSVFFGTNNPSPSVTYVSNTQITAVVPSGSGMVNVTVQSGIDETDNLSGNPNANVTAPVFGYGTSATSANDEFTYSNQTISPTNSTLSFASPTDVSGTPDLLTIVVEDTNGNPVGGLASSAFSFGLSGGTSSGSFGTVSQTSTAGTYTVNFTGSTAGTNDTLTLIIDGVQISTKPTIQVTPGAVSGTNSTVSFASSSDVSGATDTVTIVVEDAAGNAIANLANSAFGFNLSGGTSTGTFGTATQTATPGTYTDTFTGVIAGTATTLLLKVNGVQLTAQPKVTVTPGAVNGTKSTVSFAASTVASGTTDTVTVVVEDAAGNAIAGLASSAFSFSLAGGTSTGIFGTVTQTSTPGTYTGAFTGVIAGTASTLTLKVSGVQLSGQPTVQVKAGGVGGGKSTVSFASSSVSSGTADTVTVVVEDLAGNAITGLASSAFVFGLSAGTSTGTFGAVTETATPGTYTSAFTGVIAGTTSTLTLKVSGVQLTAQPQVIVTPGAISATKSTVNFTSSSEASGTTDLVTIVVDDAAGNAIAGLASSAFSFGLAGGTSTGTFGTVTQSSTPGTYTALFTGATAGTASTLTLQVSGVQLTAQPKVTVTPGAISGTKSTVSLAASTVASGQLDAATIVLEDANGNAVTGLASSAFSFSLSGGSSTGTFGTVTETATPGTYTAEFTGATAGTASAVTLQVSGVQLSSQPTIQVTTSAVSGSNSSVSFASSIDTSGTTDTATIVVEDAAGNAIANLANTAFAFSLAGGTSTGTFGTVTQTSTPGTYTAAFTGAIAGTTSTLSLTVGGVQLTTQPQMTVTPGTISGTDSSVSFASSTDVSGTTDAVTIVVEDAAGNAIANLANSAFVFSLAGGTSTGSFGAVTPTSTPGTYTTAFTGDVVGTASTLILTVSGVQLTAQPEVTVTPGAVSGTNSTVSFAASTDVSGTTDTVSIVVEDAEGNAIAGLANANFAFSLAGGTSTGTFGTVTQTSTPGTYSATFTGAIAGTASTLTLQVAGVQLSTQPEVTVTPGAISSSNSTSNFTSETVSSGQNDSVTVVVVDAAGNPIAGLSSNAFSFTLSGGTSTGTFGSVSQTSTPGTYTAMFTGVLAGTLSNLSTTIDGVKLTDPPGVQVMPGSVSGGNSTVSFANASVVTGGTDTIAIVVEDAAGNAITGLANSAFNFGLSGGTSNGTFGTVAPTSTPGTYTATFTGKTVGTASTLTLTVSGVKFSSQPTIQVTTGVVSASKSTVRFATSTDESGTPDTVRIVVEDANGDAITGLANSAFDFTLAGGKSTGTFGTVTETSTPGTYTAGFTGVTAGTASTLTVAIDGVALSTQPKVTVKAGAVSGIESTVSFARSTVAVGNTDKVTITVEDAAGNAISGLSSSAFLFDLSGGTSTGSFGTVTATKTPGVYTVVFKGGRAGTTSNLNVEVDGISLTNHPTIQVT
jgi:adhesin/invasin